MKSLSGAAMHDSSEIRLNRNITGLWYVCYVLPTVATLMNLSHLF